jgi:hypothetical protein
MFECFFFLSIPFCSFSILLFLHPPKKKLNTESRSSLDEAVTTLSHFIEVLSSSLARNIDYIEGFCGPTESLQNKST